MLSDVVPPRKDNATSRRSSKIQYESRPFVFAKLDLDYL